MSKRLLPVLFIGIIVLAVLIVHTTYFNQETPADEEKIQREQSENIYQNELLGFSVKLPEGWLVEHNQDGGALLWFLASQNSKIKGWIKVYQERKFTDQSIDTIEALKEAVVEYERQTIKDLIEDPTININPSEDRYNPSKYVQLAETMNGSKIVIVEPPRGGAYDEYSIYLLSKGTVLFFMGDTRPEIKEILNSVSILN